MCSEEAQFNTHQEAIEFEASLAEVTPALTSISCFSSKLAPWFPLPARSQFPQQHLHPSGAQSQLVNLDEINLCVVDTDLSLSKQPQLPKKLSAHFEAETKANPNKISTLSLTSSWILEDLYKTTIYIYSNSRRLS